MRTTLDLDGSVLEQLRARQRREGTSLGQLASELLAKALADTEDGAAAATLAWVAQLMVARVDLEDRDTVQATLDIDPALFAAARTELGASTNKETVNRALAEIVAIAARRRLVAQLRSGDGLDLSDPDAGRSEGWQ